MPENNSPHEMKKSRFLLIRLFWISLGSIFVGIGTIGIFVPGLPTTVFLILASACYIRSSERLYNWLIKNKTFGKYIKDFREGKGMPQRAKITALSMMTIFVLLAVLPFSPIAIPNNTMRIIVLAVGMIGFYYVSFRVPTKKD
ncbi:MAG: YbaN family protein [Chloroflexota bacterium]|nr:YbaN family protein [Chloroflexota bacterium]|tara:strand:- start:10558 stop:10986 length:429 start_codon:yes stop_codon:yes gene_type:complete